MMFTLRKSSMTSMLATNILEMYTMKKRVLASVIAFFPTILEPLARMKIQAAKPTGTIQCRA